jgi:hypothetical protein
MSEPVSNPKNFRGARVRGRALMKTERPTRYHNVPLRIPTYNVVRIYAVVYASAVRYQPHLLRYPSSTQQYGLSTH